MTRETAIGRIIGYLTYYLPSDKNEEVEEIINALEQEPCEQIKWERDTAIKQLNELGYGLGEKIKPCDDAISRQAVKELFQEACEMKMYDFLGIDDLPYVKPQEPKTGHWILTDDDFAYCSECEDSYYPRPIDASWYYCPHCGCRMEGEDME